MANWRTGSLLRWRPDKRQAVIAEAQELRLGQVFTLTLEEGFFVRLGFERVANESLPMKVWSDCVRCPKQERCDEIAMLLKLGAT